MKKLLLALMFIGKVFAADPDCISTTGGLSKYYQNSFQLNNAYGWCISPTVHGAKNVAPLLNEEMFCDQAIYTQTDQHKNPTNNSIDLTVDINNNIEIYVFYEPTTVDSWMITPHATITLSAGYYQIGIDYWMCGIKSVMTDPLQKFSLSTLVSPSDHRFFPVYYWVSLILNESGV